MSETAVVGGGAAVLAKTGLLKKLLKPILIGLVAIGRAFRADLCIAKVALYRG